MTECWYCHVNAWPAEVVDVYYATIRNALPHDRFDTAQEMHWGATHGIWEDENFDNLALTTALQHILVNAELTPIQLGIAVYSIMALLRIPESVRVPFNVDDDDYPTPPTGPMKPIPSQYDLDDTTIGVSS